MHRDYRDSLDNLYPIRRRVGVLLSAAADVGPHNPIGQSRASRFLYEAQCIATAFLFG